MNKHGALFIAAALLIALTGCDDGGGGQGGNTTGEPDMGPEQVADVGADDTPEPEMSQDVPETVEDTDDVAEPEDTLSDAIEDTSETSDVAEDVDDATGDVPDVPDVEEEPEPDIPASVCGDTTVEGDEVCDDGNTEEGDYCSADCLLVTGRCGDGVQQTNEACDDGATNDCLGTHDGGDGTCVPQGICSEGYVLDGERCIQNPTGLSVPCAQGPGWSLFRFHYDNGSESARIDVWDATCDYSFAPNSACNVQEVYPGFGDLDRTQQGFPIVTSREYIRVRFSANGLRFSTATVHLRGRSYSTGSSTDFRLWSPLYGDRFGGPVDNDFTYDWYAVDWTGQLFPSDRAALTAIQIYGDRGSGQLAVQAVELCVE